MTTLGPGASVVFTQGRLLSPCSTAFFASSAAATITEGLDVFVQEVIAAITTEPWSTSVRVPSSRVIGTGWLGRLPAPAPTGSTCGAPPSPLPPLPSAGASLAGNDSADASSTVDARPYSGWCATSPAGLPSPSVT